MSNPVFDRSPVFSGSRAATASQVTIDASTLDQMYGAPSATTRDTGRMTYDDVIIRTGGMFAVLLAAAVVTWTLAPELFIVGLVGGLVLGLVNAFKRNPSPALILGYAAFEGMFLGGISSFFDARWPGVVMQAVLATGATFLVCLFLFTSGRVRVTAKSTRIFMLALGGYLVFSLVNLALSFFVSSGDFGPLRSGPLGVVVGLLAVGLASYSLVVDFDSIKRGVAAGAPRKMAWTAAFGLVVTLVWLYMEFLRLLSILRN